jgi:hypothetical protein
VRIAIKRAAKWPISRVGAVAFAARSCGIVAGHSRGAVTIVRMRVDGG